MQTDIMTKKIALVFLFFFFIGFTLFSQPADGGNLTIKIAVIGPGSELYFWWGHIALIVENSAADRSYFYDYGLFSFDNENFFYNFAFGRLLYSCGVSYSESNLANYLYTNRDITIYTLDLPPETRVKVRDFAEVNVLPENRDYFYHHFRDNCSTRIRDIIDVATDGQFSQQYEKEVSRFTLREHVRRHTWFSPAVDWFLNFLMGQTIDTPITVWDDMFLPSEVGKVMKEFWYTDISGVRRKLVSSVETVNVSQGRPLVLDVPRKQWLFELAFGVILAIIFAFFFWMQSKNIKAGRVLAGFSISLCSLFFGIAGLLLYFMSFFTNHDYTYQNYNMIFCTPLLLASVPAGVCYAISRNPKKRAVNGELSRIIWLITVLGIFISMAVKLLPWFYQDNLTDQLLMLPIALVFAFHPEGLKETFARYFPRKKTRADTEKPGLSIDMSVITAESVFTARAESEEWKEIKYREVFEEELRGLERRRESDPLCKVEDIQATLKNLYIMDGADIGGRGALQDTVMAATIAAYEHFTAQWQNEQRFSKK